MLINTITQEQITEHEFRMLNKDMSYPEQLTDAVLADTDYRVLRDGTPPPCPTNMKVELDGVELVGGIWKTKYTLVQKTQAELNNDTQNLIHQAEQTITPRRLRDAILGIDNGWLASAEQSIAQLRTEIK